MQRVRAQSKETRGLWGEGIGCRRTAGSAVVFPLRCLKGTEMAQGVEKSQQLKGSAAIWFFPHGHSLLLPSGPPSGHPDCASEQCVPV